MIQKLSSCELFNNLGSTLIGTLIRFLSNTLGPNLSKLPISVTRLGNLLDFRQLFKACGNN